MSWFLIALIGPALWSASNHIDKYLVDRYFKGGEAGALILFSSLMSLLVLPIILAFRPDVLGAPIASALITVFGGVCYIVSIYFLAIKRDEASYVVPLYQMIPVFSFLLGYAFLGETLSLIQVAGGTLVIIGAVALSFNLDGQKKKLKSSVFGAMVVASFLGALSLLTFKIGSLETDYWVGSFWESVGVAVFGIICFAFIPKWRNQYTSLFRENKLPILGLNAFNEVITIIGTFAFNFASLLAPLALVWTVNGFQPFFVFVYGVILTVFFPGISRESLLKRHILQKLTAIAVMFVGTYLIHE